MMSTDRAAMAPTATLFRPWTNTALRLTLSLLAAGAVGSIGGLMIYVRSPLYTREAEAIAQPVQFDHRHHVSDVGIDCRYCHETVERAASAGYPSTEVCMNCHGQVWNKSPLLGTVRASYFAGVPLSWRRVHSLPDYVYFNHSIHVRKGVGCVTCHGRVDRMGEISQGAPLTMEWCLDCHRDPVAHLRPIEHVTELAWEPRDALATGRAVQQELHVRTRTSCTTCHR